MEFDKDYNVIVKKFEALDDKYVAWINRVSAAKVAGSEEKEKLVKEAAAGFEEFAVEFEMSLPEMAYIMYRDFNQTMEIDVRGVPKEKLVKMIERAKEHKIGSIIDSGSLTFCALPRQEKEPDLKLLDEAESYEVAAEEVNLAPKPVAKPAKNLIKDFRFRPDPIETVKLLQVLPAEHCLVFSIEKPEDFGSPITAIHADLELTFADRTTINQQVKLESLVDARVHLEGLKSLRQLVMTVRPQNAFGVQIKSKAWKYLFPVWHEKVAFMGRNDFSQIDTDLVPETVRSAIEANEEHDYYCDQLAEVRLPNEKLGLVKAVSRNTTLAVASNCQLLQWGLNRRFEGAKVVEEPTFMFLHPKLLVNQVALGNTFAAVTTVEGQVFAWGDNRAGQLGQGFFSNLIEKPQLVAALQGSFIVDLKCGVGHTICLDDSGVAYSWGQNQAVTGKPVFNRFGEKISFSNKSVHQHLPFAISSKIIGSDERVCWIASGEFNLGLVTSKGELFLWGDNEEDLLGDYPDVNSVVPIKIGLPFPAKRVHIGFDHSVVETVALEDGSQHFFAWGNNLEGQCGLKPVKSIKSPTEISGVPKQVSQFWCGVNRTFFVDGENRVWAVGQGLLGLFSSTTVPVCTAVVAKEINEFNGTVTACN